MGGQVLRGQELNEGQLWSMGDRPSVVKVRATVLLLNTVLWKAEIVASRRFRKWQTPVGTLPQAL